jgi:VIT1/CCC1 family predicted Fe2+/Mn2+ transporter
MEDNEPSLLQGIFLCLWDSQAVRLQTSRWKRSLLVFTSGVSLEIAVLPHLTAWVGYESSWPSWLLTLVFLPLGLVGLYASKFGNDRFVEWLLVIPKLDLKP